MKYTICTFLSVPLNMMPKNIQLFPNIFVTNFHSITLNFLTLHASYSKRSAVTPPPPFHKQSGHGEFGYGEKYNTLF